MLVIRPGTHKMPIKKANREDTDQTASSEVFRSGVCPGCPGEILV